MRNVAVCIRETMLFDCTIGVPDNVSDEEVRELVHDLYVEGEIRLEDFFYDESYDEEIFVEETKIKNPDFKYEELKEKLNGNI